MKNKKKIARYYVFILALIQIFSGVFFYRHYGKWNIVLERMENSYYREFKVAFESRELYDDAYLRILNLTKKYLPEDTKRIGQIEREIDNWKGLKESMKEDPQYKSYNSLNSENQIEILIMGFFAVIFLLCFQLIIVLVFKGREGPPIIIEAP